jgi:hypothetical protein
VDISESLKKRVLAAGFYMAHMQDETFLVWAYPMSFRQSVFKPDGVYGRQFP